MVNERLRVGHSWYVVVPRAKIQSPRPALGDLEQLGELRS
jgi:hypothetical protein